MAIHEHDHPHEEVWTVIDPEAPPLTERALALPTERDAEAIANAFAREPIASIARFPTGLAHWVYDVVTASGARLVVRIGAAASGDAFAAAERWSRRLRPLGVPLPALLEAGRHGAFPYLILERLPGSDLGLVYETLSREEKHAIASGVAHAQARVRSLPPGAGYGFVADERGPFRHATWSAVIAASIARSRARIERGGIVRTDVVERVARAATRFEPYFATVAPLPFLDDTTTKNVIVDAGRLSGIVDVDLVCFGDRLFPLALTRASLLNLGHDPDCTDVWLELLDPSAAERAALRFYTALFCLDFAAELGHRFNREAPIVADSDRIERLLWILDDELTPTRAGGMVL